MVSLLRLALCLLGLATGTIASESGVLSYNGQRYFAQGRYGDAYAQFSLALQASRKEADLGAAGRVHIALSTLSVHAREFSDAASHLAAVRISELDSAGLLALLQARLELHNAQGNYAEAYQTWESRAVNVDDDDFSEVQVARLYCEAAIAAAGAGQPSVATELLTRAEKLYDDEAPGAMAVTRAKLADLQGSTTAYELYRSALALAVSGGRYYVAGSVLLRLGQLAEQQKQSAQAIDYYERSAGVFEQLGLPRPFRSSAERLVELQGPDSPYRAKLKALPSSSDLAK